MKRIALTLAPFALAITVFFAWHTPWQGPLTEAEIQEFITTQPETGGSAWTDTDAFEAFLRADDGRPFVMVNLMELRDTAPVHNGLSAAEADAHYGQAVLPLLLRRGSYPIARAERFQTVINSLGDTAAGFDTVALVRYRSRRDLIDMLMSEPFLAAEVYKWASLENTLVAPSNPKLAFGIIGYVPFLLVIGAAAAVLAAKGKRRD